MLDFEVQRCTRRCAATDREFKAGETVYSALVPRGAEVVRQDYSAEAWQGPPENAIGWWKGRVPDGAQPKQSWAPNDVMLDYFQRLAEQPDKADACYVLALLLIRRRVLKLEEGTSDRGDELSVFCARNEKVYRIPAVLPDDARVRQIQAELRAALSGAVEAGPATPTVTATVETPEAAAAPVAEPPVADGPPLAAESSVTNETPVAHETPVAVEPPAPVETLPSDERLSDSELPSLAGLFADDRSPIVGAPSDVETH